MMIALRCGNPGAVIGPRSCFPGQEAYVDGSIGVTVANWI